MRYPTPVTVAMTGGPPRRLRSDDTVMLAFTLLNRRLDYHGFTPRFSYVFTDQHSNIPIYEFTRNQFQVLDQIGLSARRSQLD